MKLHGHNTLKGKTPEYSTWDNMQQRCGNPNHTNYPYYGGRGIIICDRWRLFSLFLEDMGNRPEGTTLDRIDNDGNYEPGNCRWATKKEQSINRRERKPTLYLTIYGKSFTLDKWAHISGEKRSTISTRYYRGWPHKQCVFGKAA